MKLNKIIPATIILACTGISAYAQSEAVQPSAAMSFLEATYSPRSMAMGGTASIGAPGAYAQFGGIAASAFSEQTFSAGVSYGMLQPTYAGSNLVSLGAVYNINKKFGITFGTSVNVNKSYETMDTDGISTGTFAPTDFRIGAGFSYRFIDGLSAGIALNYAQSSLAPKNDLYKTTLSTFAADIQVMYRISDFSISLSGNNLGLPVKSAAGTSYSLPMNAEIGAAYDRTFDRHHVSAGIEGGYYFGGPAAGFCSAGAEYMYNSLVAIRAGYHYGSEKNGLPSFASAGIGFRFAGVNIDAAYMIASGDSPMKNTFTIGVGYSF